MISSAGKEAILNEVYIFFYFGWFLAIKALNFKFSADWFSLWLPTAIPSNGSTTKEDGMKRRMKKTRIYLFCIQYSLCCYYYYGLHKFFSLSSFRKEGEIEEIVLAMLFTYERITPFGKVISSLQSQKRVPVSRFSF